MGERGMKLRGTKAGDEDRVTRARVTDLTFQRVFDSLGDGGHVGAAGELGLERRHDFSDVALEVGVVDGLGHELVDFRFGGLFGEELLEDFDFLVFLLGEFAASGLVVEFGGFAALLNHFLGDGEDGGGGGFRAGVDAEFADFGEEHSQGFGAEAVSGFHCRADFGADGGGGGFPHFSICGWGATACGVAGEGA